MILVAGSTGVLGSEIVRQLREDNKAVRALVRISSDPEKVARLKTMGATTVEGDVSNMASLVAACKDVDVVITTVNAAGARTPEDTIPNVDHMGQLQLLEAAAEAGVSHFIYVSYSRNFVVDCPMTAAKRAVEQRVMTSGMTYTILRPSHFMEVWVSPFVGFDYANKQARIYGTGENPISWVSFIDAARFAVLALEAPSARNAIIEIGGPDQLSPNQVVSIFEDASGGPFHVERVPVEALEAQRSAASDPLQQTIAALMLDYASGDPIDMEQTLKTYPVQLTSMKDYAARVIVSVA